MLVYAILNFHILWMGLIERDFHSFLIIVSVEHKFTIILVIQQIQEKLCTAQVLSLKIPNVCITLTSLCFQNAGMKHKTTLNTVVLYFHLVA